MIGDVAVCRPWYLPTLLAFSAYDVGKAESLFFFGPLLVAFCEVVSFLTV